MRISRAGVSVEVPPGWEVEILQRTPGGSLVEDGPIADSPGWVRDGPVIVHASNFPLPTERSDFGHDLVPMMSLSDTFISIVEYAPGDASKVLFQHEGIPMIGPDELSHDMVVGPVAGQAAAQRFFHVGDRAFCLYVLIGSYRLRSAALPAISSVLYSLELG